jgi:choline kinase
VIEAIPVRQTVILAAGHGQRIGSREHGIPKPLMEVAGRTLLEYALVQASAAGCEEAIVVVGGGREKLQEFLEGIKPPLKLRLLFNPDFHHPNGISLLAAESLVRGSFYLQMSDHLFGEPVLPRLSRSGAAPGECMRLLVDAEPLYSDEEDATKVRLREGRISDIGKELPTWDAVDTGCFLLDGRIFDALKGVGRPEETSVTAGMKGLLGDGLLAAVDLRGVPWVDVDTPRDREEAERIFGKDGPFGGSAAQSQF